MIDIYEEMAETSRRKILIALYHGSKTVNELVRITGLKQPNVSNHLSRLKTKEIVGSVKHGREVFYSLLGADVERLVASLLLPSELKTPKLDFAEMSLDYAKHAAAGNEEECAALFEQLFRAKTPLIDIYEGVVAPAMAMIGAWWKAGEIEEAPEHMATIITQRLLDRVHLVHGSGPRIGRTVISGLAPGVRHSLGLTVVNDYLKFSGWRTFAFGPDMPIKSFLSMVRIYRPDLVITSVHCEESLESTLELIGALNELRCSDYPFRVAVGGYLVQGERQRLMQQGADFTVPTLREFARDVLPKLEMPTRQRKKRDKVGTASDAIA